MIDDDPDHRDLITDVLGRFMFDDGPPSVRTTADPARGLEIMRRGGEWVILCDQSLRGSRGTDWLPRLVAQDAGPIIVMTTHGDDHLVREAYERGAAGYLLKDELLGVDRRRAHRIIEDARRHWRLDQRARELTSSLELANLELRRRNRHLRRITASTERFMEDVAHDLRGPLASIGGYAGMLVEGRSGPVTGEQGRHLALIHQTAVDLHGMVEDFLDAGRIRADTIVIDRRPIDVREKIEAVVGSLAPVAEQHHVQIVIDVEPGLAPAFGDRARVRRVIQNLLGNAIKHGGRGAHVAIHARRDGDDIRIAVIDDGPGIDADVATRIFTRFEQGRSEGRRTDGLGLGLAIALDFARASLGRLELDTSRETGATFTFVLPVAEDGAVRRAAERRWRQDEVDHGAWLEVVGVDESDEKQVRAWLATRLGATGVVLPTRHGTTLRAGRPGRDLDEWVESLEDARKDLPQGDALRAVTTRPIGCLPFMSPETELDDVHVDVKPATSFLDRGQRAADGPPSFTG